MTRRKQRIWFLVGGLSVLGLVTALILSALSDKLVYFYSPTELAEKAIPPGQSVRVGGLVEKGSLQGTNGADLVFTITDLNSEVSVAYSGLLPDLFREGQGVVVEGALTPAGQLQATRVLAKHDENYMPKEVADALKEQGEWKPDDTLVYDE